MRGVCATRVFLVKREAVRPENGASAGAVAVVRHVPRVEQSPAAEPLFPTEIR